MQKSFIAACKARNVLRVNVSRENKKLVPSGDIAFIIWNLPAIITCPHATEHCKAACYALKAERAYPDCLPSRERNFQASRADDFAIRVAYTILSIAAGTRKKKIIVRIHESGDFYNREYVKKWLAVMEMCKGANITFIAYTKSFPFFDGVALPENFALRASIWDDTTEKALDTIERNSWNIYTAVERFTSSDTFHQCRCSDCATCGKCWDNSVHDIRCEIH